jgi:hypothetical protein
MKSSLIPIIAACCLMPPPASATDSVQAAAAEILENRSAHTLTLTVTRKAGNNDRSFEVTAVAVNSSGLLATSINALEGASAIDNMMAAAMGGDGNRNAGELTRVAWLRDDATEVEGELVLKDDVLDLAFIRLEAGDADMPTVPEAAKDRPAILDPTVSIDRLSGDFQRTPRIGLGHVSALITTPREYLRISDDLSYGAAVYNMAGEWLGIVVSIEDETLVVPADAIIRRAESVAAADNNN